MLFKVEASKDTFSLNPGLKAIQEFERLTERQMTYVILTADYKSPFRKLTSDDRKLQAALIAGYKMESDGKRPDTNTRNLINGKTTNVEAAIKKYYELQRDEDYETLMSLNRLIAQIREFNNKPDKTSTELKTAVDMNVQKLDKLIETKQKIEELIDMREDEAPKLTNTPQIVLSVDEEHLPLLSKYNAEKELIK
jgi:hypothetical protein